MIFVLERSLAGSRRLNISILLLVGLLCGISAASLWAQRLGGDSTGTGGRHTIQGRIFLPSGRHAEMSAKVSLESTNSGAVTTISDSNGLFVFNNLGAGPYRLTVDAGNDYEIVNETVEIDRALRAPILTVPIHLQPKRPAGLPDKPGVLDASLANVPKPAQDFFQKGLDAGQAGDHQNAVEYLEKAIALHAKFAPAFNELGVRYLKLGQPAKAAEAWQSALKIAPEALGTRLNYGFALLELKEYAKAEEELRQVLKKNAALPVAHLYLGIALIGRRQFEEAEKELQVAAGNGGHAVHRAHYYLGGLYWRNKEYRRAVEALEKYLELAPQAPDAERVRRTIQELRGKL